MADETKERWYQLCALAAVENDPTKLLAMATEINRLLAEKEQILSPSQRTEMRRTWRDLARKIDEEEDLKKMHELSSEMNEALFAEERRKVLRKLGRTTVSAA